jgi:hypothetical protein
MRRIIFPLFLVVAAIACLGFYQGWFQVASDNTDGKSNVTLSVDTDKFQEDRKTAMADVQGAGRQIKDKVSRSSDKTISDKTISDKTIDGTLVSLSPEKLTMTSNDGKEHSRAVTADVKITCDGKVCKAADLKPGMRVRVTTENVKSHAASRIEALDINRDFDKGA